MLIARDAVSGAGLLVILLVGVFICLILLATALNISVRPVFAWYDLWVGVFVQPERKQLYFFPIPVFGFLIRWGDHSG